MAGKSEGQGGESGVPAAPVELGEERLLYKLEEEDGLWVVRGYSRLRGRAC